MTAWEHVLMTIMIPTVNRYAVRYGMRDPTGELYQLYHSQVDIDGVLVIWKETQKPAVQQA